MLLQSFKTVNTFTCTRFPFRFFWDIFPSMCERKRKQHKTFAAQAGEMCENEHARNYEWHYGRLGAECYKLKVYKRENYKALLWENCIFSSVTPAVPLESPLLASIYCLNWELPPCCGYLATCKLNSFEYPSSSFFYLPSCCCFFFFSFFVINTFFPRGILGVIWRRKFFIFVAENCQREAKTTW